jgi:hypothetical protein
VKCGRARVPQAVAGSPPRPGVRPVHGAPRRRTC